MNRIVAHIFYAKQIDGHYAKGSVITDVKNLLFLNNYFNLILTFKKLGKRTGGVQWAIEIFYAFYSINILTTDDLKVSNPTIAWNYDGFNRSEIIF